MSTTPFTPRRPARELTSSRGTRKHTGTDSNKSLQYFKQLLDLSTMCQNALRQLRIDNKENDKWFTELQQDEWMFKYDFPVKVKC